MIYNINSSADLTKLSWDKKLIKEDLDNTLEMLNNYEKIYKDIRTTYDCVLYQTANGWQAVVDTTEKVGMTKKKKALFIKKIVCFNI